jgi:hypothetical protein
MRRAPAGLRRTAATSLVAALICTSALVASCGQTNPGFEPPTSGLAFPSGLLLDPRVSSEPTGPCSVDAPCGAGELCTSAGQCRASASWLLVTNANSDRRYNAGSLVAVNLDLFWHAAFDDPTKIHPASSSLDEFRGDDEARDPDYRPGDGIPCRRVANLPQVVECLEEPFILDAATILFGNFPGPTVAWDMHSDKLNPTPDPEEAMLLIPVRGDPSITYAEISGSLDGDDLHIDDLHIECGQGEDRRCDDDHRLRFLRNDPEASRLSREPFRVLVSPQPEQPLAYVSHQGDPDLTLLALDGLVIGDDDRPAIVHQPDLLGIANASFAYQGGFGLAQRPDTGDVDPDPNDDPECADEASGRTGPLVYAGMRFVGELQPVRSITYAPLCGTAQTCIAPDELDVQNGIVCEPQLEPVGPRVQLNDLPQVLEPHWSRPILADIAFSRTGNELYVVQSNPGALLRIDTSLGVDGEPLDVPVGLVEICAQPTTFLIYDDGGVEYGLVTCYRSGEIFIVDLANLTVVGLTRAGIGPDAMAVDLAREVVYVANSLDATVSVISMAASSPSRFTQIARLGLQEPYVQ